MIGAMEPASVASIGTAEVAGGLPRQAKAGTELRRFFRRFIPVGGFVFDIGAHAGNWVDTFRRLVARVVVLEPQPDLVDFLQRRNGQDEYVMLCSQTALGASRGRPGQWPAHESPL